MGSRIVYRAGCEATLSKPRSFHLEQFEVTTECLTALGERTAPLSTRRRPWNRIPA